MGVDGFSPLPLHDPINDGLFVVVRHRNHITILSASALTESHGIFTYDFTTVAGQKYGSNAQKDLGGGKFGIFGGDANADGTVNAPDLLLWKNSACKQGYRPSDMKLDGQTDNRDKNEIYLPNEGISTNVPK